ncbi:hypothetical protein ABH14_17200 [Brevibacillus brevis]|nr:hypothetical protein [Brevibacillus brevis]
MSRIDKRNRLDENPFHYRVAKDQTVFIDYQGKLVKTLKGKEIYARSAFHNKYFSRKQTAQGRYPAAIAVASSAKNTR